MACCQHCATELAPAELFCCNCGKKVLVPQTPTADTPFFVTLPTEPLPVLTPRVLTIGTIIIVVIIGLWQIGSAIIAHNEQVAAIAAADVAAKAAAKAELERQQRLSATLTRLRMAYPSYHFALYPGDSGTATFNAQFDKTTVRTVSIARTAGSYSMTVTMYGSQTENQAPKINVSLLDEKGTLLARKAIVEFINADLSPGETRPVTDSMDIPSVVAPSFIAVDEGNT